MVFVCIRMSYWINALEEEGEGTESKDEKRQSEWFKERKIRANRRSPSCVKFNYYHLTKTSALFPKVHSYLGKDKNQIKLDFCKYI